MASERSEILQGTLDLMVLKTLASMGSLHGYGIARRIEQISEEALLINQGTIYASLVRLMHKGWITGAWGTSENNRKAKIYGFYKIWKETARHRNELGANFGRDWSRVAHCGERITR